MYKQVIYPICTVFAMVDVVV